MLLELFNWRDAEDAQFLKEAIYENDAWQSLEKENKMHLLVVDDDPSILELMESIIQFSTDHTAETASCVADAIDLLARPEAKKFDCFLMDIQMPGTDGIEFCRVLRNRPDYKRSPIMMLTAMSEKTYIDRAFAAGADDYIAKPFEVGDLRERLGLL